jgi:hypothetical protein
VAILRREFDVALARDCGDRLERCERRSQGNFITASRLFQQPDDFARKLAATG